jgi:hypothetical protein
MSHVIGGHTDSYTFCMSHQPHEHSDMVCCTIAAAAAAAAAVLRYFSPSHDTRMPHGAAKHGDRAMQANAWLHTAPK